MTKAGTIGLIAALTLTVGLFAAPALSTSSRSEATINQRVRALERSVRTLRAQVASARRLAVSAQGAAAGAQTAAGNAQATASSAGATASRLDGCLSRALPLTRYDGFVHTSSLPLFTDYEPDIDGRVPNISSGSFGIQVALDVTVPFTSVQYYVALVEPGCAGGFRIAQRQEAVGR